MPQHYKDLIAWKKAMDLVNAVYDATDAFPKREMNSLTDQMRRAAVSIPSKMAEGQARYSNREFIHFLRNARGSLAELETQILGAEKRRYLSQEPAKDLLYRTNELSRLLSGLINSLNQRERERQG